MSDPAAPARILLVRHGQSTWNADGRWQGQADPPLSVLGEGQAREAGSSSEVAAVERWWSSDLVRARTTAELLAPGEQVDLDSRLRERHAGAWEGLTRAEIEAGWPGFLAAHRRPEGWEDDDDVIVRVRAALADIGARHRGEKVVAVTHGGVIRAVERSLAAEELSVPNLGGRWVEVRDASLRLGDRVLLVDVGHVTIPGQT